MLPHLFECDDLVQGRLRSICALIGHTTPFVCQSIGDEEPDCVDDRCYQEAVTHGQALLLQESRNEAARGYEDREGQQGSFNWLWDGSSA